MAVGAGFSFSVVNAILVVSPPYCYSSPVKEMHA